MSRFRVAIALLWVALPAFAAAKAAVPAARPVSPQPFASTPERVERGRYLANGILQCFVCHSERDWDTPGAPPRAGMLGAGQVISEKPGRRIVAPNITPD